MVQVLSLEGHQMLPRVQDRATPLRSTCCVQLISHALSIISNSIIVELYKKSLMWNCVECFSKIEKYNVNLLLGLSLFCFFSHFFFFPAILTYFSQYFAHDLAIFSNHKLSFSGVSSAFKHTLE